MSGTRVSAWLTLEVKTVRGGWTVKITGVRQSRPKNQLAVLVTLDIPEEVLIPKALAMVEAGHIVLDLVEEEPLDGEDEGA